MSEIFIDPNSVKITTPPMHYYEPTGGSRLFIVAEWSDGLNEETYHFGFYTSTGTSTAGTSHLKHTWVPTYGIDKDGVIFKIIGDRHKTKGASKFGRAEGVLARVADILGKIMPPEEVDSIIEKHKSGPPVPEEGQIAIINARFRREGVYRMPFYYDPEIQYKYLLKKAAKIWKRARERGETIESRQDKIGALQRSVGQPRGFTALEFRKYLQAQHKLEKDTRDKYGRKLNEGHMKLSEAALRRLVRKLVECLW